MRISEEKKRKKGNYKRIYLIKNNNKKYIYKITFMKE